MLIILITAVHAYFEQKLTRHVHPFKNIAISDVVTTIQPAQCHDDLLKYVHNDTYVSQICFNKNVFYNIDVVLGDNVTQTSLFQLAVDLSSPWTWYKSKACKSCRNINTLEFEIDDDCKKSSKKSCFEANFTQSYNATKWNDKKVQGQIYSEDSLLQGTFQTDTLQMLAYNSSQKMTISQFLSYEWGNQTPPTLAKVAGLQMLQVDQFNSNLPMLADGVLGFGFGYTETETEKARSDTDFVEKMVQQNSHLQLTRQQFALYTYESSQNFSEMVIQVGGFDYKYAHKKESNTKWVNRLEKSAYYWMVQIDSIQYKNGQGNDLINTNLPITKAIFTLSSQFIEMPYSLLIQLIKSLQMLHSDTTCELVDKEMYVLYCTNLYYDDLAAYRFIFKFANEIVEIDNWHLMLRDCKAANENQNKQNCLFNIKVSTSNYVILGEPFMKNHYIIFENQPGNEVRRIGILPAAIHEYYPMNPDQYEWPLFKAILFIFLFGLISICSVTFLRSFCKDLFRAFKYRKTPNPEDQQSLRIPKDIDYVDYSTQEEIQAQMKDIQMTDSKKIEEWNKQQEQFNFSQQFTNSIEQNSL